MAYLSLLAQGLVPYTAGEQPKDRRYIKLNTNENPYPPSPKVQGAVQAAMERLPLYPDMDSTSLREIIANLHGLSPAQVFCGNGSDEVLAFAFAAFFAGKPLLAPDVTYSFYPTYAKLYNVDYRQLPLAHDFSLRVEDYMGDVPVVLANPNAPTGRMVPVRDLERLAAHLHEKKEVFLVDEAYADFAREQATELLHSYDNVLIVRTLSKSHGLAGLRLGYALGSPALIEGLNRVKNSFNSYPVDCLAQAAAEAALSDVEYTKMTRDKVVAAREKTTEALLAAGIEVIPSDTNFLFVKAGDGAAVRRALREEGILVRHFQGKRTAPYLRVSIGTDAEMEKVTEALIRLIAGHSR